MDDEAQARLITREQLAKRYVISPRSIDRLVQRKVIPVIRLTARCLRFDPQKCDAAIDRFEQVEATRGR